VAARKGLETNLLLRHLGRTLVTVAGLALAAWLVMRQGFDEVVQAVHKVGFSGLGSITLLHVVPTLLCSLAWWLLLRRQQAAQGATAWQRAYALQGTSPLADYVWVRWIRDGLDSVVPILPVSGELVAVRLLKMRGVTFADASTIVDLTAELLGQVVFAMLAFALLLLTHPHAHHLRWIGAGITVLALQCVGFLYAQKKGLFRLIEHPLRWLRSKRHDLSPDDRPLHDRLLTLYADQEAFLACLLLHVLAWMAGAAEGWLGLWLMGHPLGLADVLSLEGLVLGARSLAFFVPLAAGVQEGAYMGIAGLIGLSPELALAVSLLKRGRDLAIGVPALLMWQMVEARELGRVRRRGDAV
jgi:putative membrane protein